VGRFDQGSGARSEGMQRVDRRLLDTRKLGACGVASHQRHQGGLAGGRILAHGLADGRGVAFRVEQVVGDLEGEAELGSIPA
jgi:hypothetical protein